MRTEADEAARKARARGGDADAAAAEVYAKYECERVELDCSQQD